MPDLPIHTFDFGQGGISGSLYFRSKRASELSNTTHLTRNDGFLPIGYGSLASIQSSSDGPEARELYPCFRPLTADEIQHIEDNEWKRRYVELPVSTVFPSRLPDALKDRERVRKILNNRGGGVEITVLPPPAKEDSPPGKPATPTLSLVEPPKPACEPAVPRRVSIRSIPVTQATPPVTLVYRPLTAEEQRLQMMNMAAALAYITRVRQPFPEPSPRRTRRRLQ